MKIQLKIGWLYLISVLSVFGCSKKESLPFSHWTEPVTNTDFVYIPGGEFLMGNPNSDLGNNHNDQIHLVKISHGFWMATKEVTQEQWRKVMGEIELHPDKPSPFWGENPNYPKVSISWFDVQTFLKKLEEQSPGNRFRLPTEAEWEYACRAGTVTNFSTGDFISDSLANFNAEINTEYATSGKYLSHPAAVGSYPPNNWGLYDMHGNVFEWVSDWYRPYSKEKTINPLGPVTGELKIIRGGSWYFSAEKAQSFYRMTHNPSYWGFSIGFRIVLENRNL